MYLKYIFVISLLCSSLSVSGGNGIDGKKYVQREDGDMVREYLSPVRILWTSDANVFFPDNLLKEFDGQVSTNKKECCVLSGMNGKQGSILLDFGKELQGGIQVVAAMRVVNRPAKIRIRLGESVTEAMSDVNTTTATNEHAMRDFELDIPWLGSIEVGNSGFRFVRIDLIEKNVEVPLMAVRAISKYRDIPYLGQFRCDNDRLNKIWDTGAYTVHLNMQNYLWDGIKRDRLVWVGDMHPEVMTINTVFGAHPVVNKSLDYARNDTPLPGWMNGMCSYSLWWILIQRDWYLYQGNISYLKEQHAYLSKLLSQVIDNVDGNKENLKGAMRFLDWPTSEKPKIIHAGLQALMVMSLEAGAELAGWLHDIPLMNKCNGAVKRLRTYIPKHYDNKQAVSLLSIAGLVRDEECRRVITCGGAEGFSTFYGYYMLEALAKAGDYENAMRIISDYWGGMLDLGATTFWEDLNYGDLKKAGRIDEFVPNGVYDLHKEGGTYCYRGLRHSLCHGWASGPTSWLSKYVLGVIPLEPGCKKIKISPHLGDLKWVEGAFPTPYGVIRIHHEKMGNDKVKSRIEAPQEITVIQ